LSSTRQQRFVALADAELCGAPVVSGSGCGSEADTGHQYKGPSSGVDKYALADLEVVRESDFGVNDQTIQTVTHLGNLVSAGDVIMGYDLANTNGGDWELEEKLHSNFVIPDVVLVRKVSGDADKNQTTRIKGDDENPMSESKKKGRRRNNGGKRMRQLEESAQRMGFLEGIDEHEYDPAAMEAELANDPELAAEVSALERDFDALGTSLTTRDRNEEREEPMENPLNAEFAQVDEGKENE
jgi:hypothetical protein